MSTTTKSIPGAKKYSIDAEGNVLNTKSDTPVFAKEGKVNLTADDGKRKDFDVEALVAELFGGEAAEATETEAAPAAKKGKAEKPAKAPTAKKPAKEATEAKTRGAKGSGITAEIRALFAEGKTREDVIALGKYNPSTVRVQFGHFINKK